jgi:membrane associated rhomboid family serine protease
MASSSSAVEYGNYDAYGDEERQATSVVSNINNNNGRPKQQQQQHRWFKRPKGRNGNGTSTKNDGLLAEQSGDINDDDDDETQVYIVRQRHGYASYGFSIVQTIVLIVMMVQCGIAPLNINPMIGPYPHVLSEWGGKNTILILEDGEWWRLITPIFLHAGVIHLVCNIMVQLETGAFFEREWGTFTWLVIYLVSAIGSTALSVIVMPDAISVGSSGAVMGLFGGKAAEVICRCCESSDHAHEKVGHQVRKEQCAGVMCSVTVVMLFSFIPYVDWAAHLGGLIAGFCIGMIMFAIDLKKALFSKLTWLFVGIGITAAYFIVLFHQMYSQDVEAAEELRDVCGYYKQYFQDYECNCQRQQ